MMLRLARIGSLLLTMAAIGTLSAPAWARDRDGWERGEYGARGEHGERGEYGAHGERGSHRHQAPEIDPAVIGGAIALVTGGAVLLRARRSRRSNQGL